MKISNGNGEGKEREEKEHRKYQLNLKAMLGLLWKATAVETS